MDNRIFFLQNCLLNSSPHFIRLLSELLKFDWLPGQDKKFIFGLCNRLHDNFRETGPPDGIGCCAVCG